MYSALLSSVVLIASSVVLTSPSWGLLSGFRGLGWAMVTSSYIGTVILIVVSWRERVSYVTIFFPSPADRTFT